MSRLKTVSVSIALGLMVASSGFSQLGPSSQHYTIEEGALTLNGTFRQLAGIQASSTGGHLCLANFDLAPIGRINDSAPFSLRDGRIVQNSPTRITVGVLGADKHVDLEGATRTGFRYRETMEIAINGDLTMDISLGDSSPYAIPGQLSGNGLDGGYTGTDCGSAPVAGGPIIPGRSGEQTLVAPIGDDRFFTIVDGALTLNGTFDDLYDIRAQSDEGFLSLAELKIGKDSIPDYSPFPITLADTYSDWAKLVQIGVSRLDHRIDIEGTTTTGIQYSNSDPLAISGDLSVKLGLGTTPPARLSFGVVPEPSSACLCLLGCLACLAIRRRR